MEPSKKRTHDEISDNTGDVKGDKHDQAEHQERPQERRRIIGPSLPPPGPQNAEDSNNEEPETASSDTDNSDDDIGPMLPSMNTARNDNNDKNDEEKEDEEEEEDDDIGPPQVQRDQWMLELPEPVAFGTNIDPTKLKNRKFQSGRSAQSSLGSKGTDGSWTESPQDKIKRLQDSVMGVNSSSVTAGTVKNSAVQQKKAAQNEKMKEQMVSLLIRIVFFFFCGSSCNIRIVALGFS